MTDEQRQIAPPVDHPVVRTHPETGRKCLYLGDHAEYIVGMDYEAGRKLIEELNSFALQADLIYEHEWQVHQLLIWDNRCLMHKATTYDPFTQKRVIRRCTVLGEIPH
jgi:taurine dioxygenase